MPRTLAQSLTDLADVKAAIKASIIAKGQEVASNDPMSAYAGKIDAIQTGTPITGKTTVSGIAKEEIAAGDPTKRLYYTNYGAGQQEALPSPISFGAVVGTQVAYSPDKTLVAFTFNASPWLDIYKLVNGAWVKQTIDVAPSSSPYGVAWSADNKYLLVQESTPAYATFAFRNNLNGTFTKLTLNIGYTVAQWTGSIELTPSGHFVLCASISSVNYFCLLKNNDNDTFNICSRLSLTSGSTAFNRVGVHPGGLYYAVLDHYSSSAAGIKIFKRTGDSIASLKTIAPPSVHTYFGLVYSPDGTKLIASIGVSPFVAQFNVSGEDYTLQSNPATLPSGTTMRPEVSPDGRWAAFPRQSSNSWILYEITPTGLVFSTTFTVGVGSGANRGEFVSNGKYLTCSAASGTTFRNVVFTPEAQIWKVGSLPGMMGNIVDIGYAEDAIALDATGNMVSIAKSAVYPV